jgi:hypothetical protein
MELFWIGYMLACTVIELVCIRLLMAGYLAAVTVAPTTPVIKTRRHGNTKQSRKPHSRPSSPLESVVVQTSPV